MTKTKKTSCVYHRLLCYWNTLIAWIVNCLKVHIVLCAILKHVKTLFEYLNPIGKWCVFGAEQSFCRPIEEGEWHRKDMLQFKHIFFFKTRSCNNKLDYLLTNTSRLILLYVFLDNLIVSVACIESTLKKKKHKTLTFG